MSPINRTSKVIAIAPVAPPCFSTRQQWLEFLAAAAAVQRSGHAPGPLVIRPGHETVFDHQFDFCKDCTGAHQHAMRRAKKCKPDHLLALAPAESATA